MGRSGAGLESDKVGVGLFDGFGVCLALLVFGERPVSRAIPCAVRWSASAAGRLPREPADADLDELSAYALSGPGRSSGVGIPRAAAPAALLLGGEPQPRQSRELDRYPEPVRRATARARIHERQIRQRQREVPQQLIPADLRERPQLLVLLRENIFSDIRPPPPHPKKPDRT